MLAHIPMDKQILRKWLKSGYMEKGVYHDTEAGTPQGGIISPVLANMVLDGLEAHLLAKFPRDIWIYNPATQKADRVGFKTLEDGRKVRVFKSNGENVDA